MDDRIALSAIFISLIGGLIAYCRKLLKDSHNRYDTITSNVNEYFFKVEIKHSGGIEIKYSAMCGFITGYAPEEFEADPELWSKIILPEDRELVRKHTENTINGDDVPILEFRFTRKNGEVCWGSLTNILFRDTYGRIIRYDVIMKDVTYKKKYEAEIKSLNNALVNIKLFNKNLMRSKDEDQIVSSVCEHVVKICGYAVCWILYTSKVNGSDRNKSCYYGDSAIFDCHNRMAETPEHQHKCLAQLAMHERKTVYCNRQKDQHECGFSELSDYGVGSILATPLINRDTLLGVLTIFSKEQNPFDKDEVEFIEGMASDLAYAISNMRLVSERDYANALFSRALLNTLTAIGKIMERRDPYTSGHQKRVANLAAAIGRELGLSAKQVEGLEFGASIHDVGKIGIPSEMLAKPTRLTDVEFQLIMTHSLLGFEIIKDIEFPWPVSQMVLQHHERLDGSGYPNGLMAKDIILEARIIAVADVVEAMSSHRPYRPGHGIEAALKEVEIGKGKYFDSDVVDACLRLFREKNYTLM